jgi:hypothetical protein
MCAEIAGLLGISFMTVACHRQHILEKTGNVNTAALMLFAVRSGLLDGRSPATGLTCAGSGRSEGLREELTLLSDAISESRSLREQFPSGAIAA